MNFSFFGEQGWPIFSGLLMAVGFMECFSVLEALNENTVTPM